MTSRYSWKEMSDDYIASYYNDEDFNNGRTFVVVDNNSGREYTYPVLEKKVDEHNNEYFQRIVPSELWNQEFFNFCSLTSPDASKYTPDKFITPELIKIGLQNTSSTLFLKRVPKKLLTEDLYVLAVKHLPESLGLIPIQYRTYELCRDTVIKSPKTIRKTPSQFITSSFYQELLSLGVKIPEQYMSYVLECIKINEEDMETTPVIIPDSENYSNFENIRLDGIEGFFSGKTLEFLLNNGIETVGKLFERTNKADFINLFYSNNKFKKGKYDEIMGSTNILRCKYLDDDPLIDGTMDEEETCVKFGFSARSANCLKRAGYGAKELFEIVRSNNPERQLLNIRTMGQLSVSEIITKVSIVDDYYKSKSRKVTNTSDLTKELEQLLIKDEQLKSQIKLVLDKLNEKNNNKGIS